MDDVPGLADAVIAAQDELAAVLAATPGVAGTVTANADALVAAADHFADLADLVVGAEPELAAFLSGTVALSEQAAGLLVEERAGVQDAVRVERCLDAAHHVDLHRVLQGEEVLLLPAR